MLYAIKPSRGFLWLQTIGRLEELLPELYRTIGVKQDKRWHPEGDVFIHSLQALDAAVSVATEYGYEGHKKVTLCYAALCHDLGKVDTTFEDATGIHSYGHAQKGSPLAKSLLQRIVKDQKKFIDAVAVLVHFHMMPGMLVRLNARSSRYHVLASTLWPLASMEQLGLLAFADRKGRNAQADEPLLAYDTEIESFMKKITEEEILHRPLAPLLTGKDLLPFINEGEKMGRILQKAYKIQLEENVKNKEELKKRILRNV
jgi:tRNA nucleotidyltransferase (CCA-adding enzyme)